MGGFTYGFWTLRCGSHRIWHQCPSIEFRLKGVPLSYWHDQFFSSMDAEFGRLSEVSLTKLNKISLIIAWLKVEVMNLA